MTHRPPSAGFQESCKAIKLAGTSLTKDENLCAKQDSDQHGQLRLNSMVYDLNVHFALNVY